jgi:predicted dinucleotide-binding enzyme
MKIAIIGSGNVGSALAEKWSAAGHAVVFGTREPSNFKG